jgi:hypothetical protein
MARSLAFVEPLRRLSRLANERAVQEKNMNRVILALLFCTFAGLHSPVQAQEKAKPEESEKKAESKKEAAELRVQVVFTEYDGEKKMSSLPYTLLVGAPEGHIGSKSSIRMGLRVPVVTGSFKSGSESSTVNQQFTYIDLGSNLDGWASKEENGRFNLHLNLERSSAYSSGSGQKASAISGNEVLLSQPVIQQFKTEVDLFIRDGQTIQSTLATDPVSGRVTKVEVTVNVVK